MPQVFLVEKQQRWRWRWKSQMNLLMSRRERFPFHSFTGHFSSVDLIECCSVFWPRPEVLPSISIFIVLFFLFLSFAFVLSDRRSICCPSECVESLDRRRRRKICLLRLVLLRLLFDPSMRKKLIEFLHCLSRISRWCIIRRTCWSTRFNRYDEELHVSWDNRSWKISSLMIKLDVFPSISSSSSDPCAYLSNVSGDVIIIVSRAYRSSDENSRSKQRDRWDCLRDRWKTTIHTFDCHSNQFNHFQTNDQMNCQRKMSSVRANADGERQCQWHRFLLAYLDRLILHSETMMTIS